MISNILILAMATRAITSAERQFSFGHRSWARCFNLGEECCSTPGLPCYDLDDTKDGNQICTELKTCKYDDLLITSTKVSCKATLGTVTTNTYVTPPLYSYSCLPGNRRSSVKQSTNPNMRTEDVEKLQGFYLFTIIPKKSAGPFDIMNSNSDAFPKQAGLVPAAAGCAPNHQMNVFQRIDSNNMPYHIIQCNPMPSFSFFSGNSVWHGTCENSWNNCDNEYQVNGKNVKLTCETVKAKFSTYTIPVKTCLNSTEVDQLAYHRKRAVNGNTGNKVAPGALPFSYRS